MSTLCCRERAWCPAAWISAALVAMIAAAVGLGLPPIAQALPTPLQRVERVQAVASAEWPAAAVQRVVIESGAGIVELIGNDSDTIRAIGHFACGAGAVDAPRLSLTADDGTLRIAPDAAADGKLEKLVVGLPANFHIVVRSAAGGVTGRDLTGVLDIQSLAGDIELHAVSGQIAAEVSAGAITVVHDGSWSPGESLSCKSLDGDIDITLPVQSEFDLAVKSLNAPFESDFPITVRGSLERRAFQSRVGNGGPAIDLNTLDGAITLRQHN